MTARAGPSAGEVSVAQHVFLPGPFRIDRTFLDPDDDAEWGPLKGREMEDSPPCAVPLRDAKRISEVLAEEGISGALFSGLGPR